MRRPSTLPSAAHGYRGSARSRRPRLSLLKTRFERIDGGARQESDGDNVSEPLDGACAGRVLPEHNVNSHFIIIGSVFRKNSSKVLGIKNNQMIGALAPD